MFTDKLWLNNLYTCICNRILCGQKKIKGAICVLWKKMSEKNGYMKKNAEWC